MEDDTILHSSDASFKGYENWEAQEKARNDALIDRLFTCCEGSESGPPCSHTTKCHGHCREGRDLRAASHYPCFHCERASLETATLDTLEARRRADAPLHSEYRAQVNPDPAPADQLLTAGPARCPDCLQTHNINRCGVLKFLHNDPDDAAYASKGDESMGPEFSQHPYLHGIVQVMRQPCHVHHALIASVTSVNVPRPCSIPYDDWQPYYTEDLDPSALPDWGIKGKIGAGTYRWNEPHWRHPHIRVDGGAGVPVTMLSKVIEAVHYVTGR